MVGCCHWVATSEPQSEFLVMVDKLSEDVAKAQETNWKCRGHVCAAQSAAEIVVYDFATLCAVANFLKVHTFRLQNKAFLYSV